MTHLHEASAHTVQFYATGPYPCSYIPNYQARSLVASPSHLVQADVYSELVAQGFRRSGLFTYRPYCDNCQACQPLRIPVQEFRPTRSQTRAWRQHHNLQARTLKLEYLPEHYHLYREYQRSKHPGGGMDGDGVEQYAQFLLQSHVNTLLVEFRAPQQIHEKIPGQGQHTGELKMVCIIDVIDDAWSAVYTFYKPEAHASYGTYAILWQIEQARLKGLNHLYLGYWIPDNRKMSYKTRFFPHEILHQAQWVRSPIQSGKVW